MIRTLKLAYLFFFLLMASVADANTIINNVITDAPLTITKKLGKPSIEATHYRLVKINTTLLQQALINVSHVGDKKVTNVLIDLPLPDGSMHRYQVLENNTLNANLAAKFPEIKTYNAYGVTNPKEYVKFDLTPLGFHAMIMTPGKSTVFIDPYNRTTTTYYLVYKKSDFITNKKGKCEVSTQSPSFKYFSSHHSINYFTCFLRKYRLALAATAQYTIFTGGTVMSALAAQAVTVNRINGVYETDVGITLEIISNNDAIIYTNPAAQPYTSGSASAMIGENQTNIDAVIGTVNYDIGHVFDQSPSGSGLAGLGVVCNASFKAEGVTGSNSPVGDPFDIDYVAHEMGHQYNANHIFNNSCGGNRNNATAVEPGSGSTIMGYAGICPPNVQRNSDAYFNGINLQEIGSFVDGAGDVCAVKTAIPAAPVVTLPTNIIIPSKTPFALTAIATGAGSADYTYCWEQQNNEISPQPPSGNSLGGPNFRSFTPTLSASRFLPNLTSLANNGPFTWEVLPNVSRTMNFRISVRANTAGGSCNAYQNMTVTTVASAGPFKVTYPTTPNILWVPNTQQTITWNVANTNNAPISAATVNIFLSTDGGQTYNIALATGAPNNGSYTITVPMLNTTAARVMVVASNGSFFNISQNNFQILEAIPIIAPTLTVAARNPLNLTTAFIYFNNPGNVTIRDAFTTTALPNVSISLDAPHNRFVITGITTPRKVANVSIIITRIGGLIGNTNSVTIPDILG